MREDSLDAASHVPLDVSPNARDRNIAGDQRLDTLIHMQFPSSTSSSTAVRVPAAWEIAVPTGDYNVTVSVGDAAANFDSTHRINVEGQVAVNNFVPTSAERFRSATTTVRVSDGRLTIDARGGTNTKIDYVDANTADTTPPAAPTNVTATRGSRWDGTRTPRRTSPATTSTAGLHCPSAPVAPRSTEPPR